MAKNIKFRERVKYLPFAGFFLEKIYRKVTGRRSLAFEIRKHLNRIPYDATILQVGSNDGITNDPLHELIVRHQGWRGIFVEPVPALFEKLRTNYGNSPRFVFINAAINDGKPATFYFVDPQAKSDIPDLPDFTNQLGSFDRNHIIGFGGGVLEAYIRCLPVQGVSLKQLLCAYKIEDLHILHIDAEGYDWKILQQLDLERYKPQIILFEHHHLSDAARAASKNYLASHYKVVSISGDSFCTRQTS